MKPHMQEKRGTHFFGVFLKLFLILMSLVGAFFIISIVLAKAMQQKEVRDYIRHFNRQRLNPAALKIAGNRSRIYASIEHVGRHSGRIYATPVVARPLEDGFVVPLPYGADADWCRNVRAAGACKLHWNGMEYAMDKPEIIAPSQALSAFPISQRIIFSLSGIQQFLLLHTVQEMNEKIEAKVEYR